MSVVPFLWVGLASEKIDYHSHGHGGLCAQSVSLRRGRGRGGGWVVWVHPAKLTHPFIHSSSSHTFLGQSPRHPAKASQTHPAHPPPRPSLSTPHTPSLSLVLLKLTVLLHDLEELDRHLGGGPDQHLLLAPLLRVRDGLEGIGQHTHAHHDCDCGVGMWGGCAVVGEQGG